MYTYTHVAYTTVDLVPFCSFISLAEVPAYTPQPVLLFSVIWETLLVGLNEDISIVHNILKLIMFTIFPH